MTNIPNKTSSTNIAGRKLFDRFGIKYYKLEELTNGYRHLKTCPDKRIYRLQVALENISDTAQALKDKEKRLGIKPYDADWFKIWFPNLFNGSYNLGVQK